MKDRSDDGKLDKAGNPPTPVFKSQDLFGPHTTIIIEHRGQSYRLMITKQDKLILNK